jgi:hypothetical protein
MSGTAVWGVGGLDFMSFSPQERQWPVVERCARQSSMMPAHGIGNRG